MTNPKNILVMQTGGWIGDMVLLTPSLRALRRKFPNAHIEMLVNPLVHELMERNPYIDEAVVYDKRGKHRGFLQMQQMARKLKAKQFDTAIILHPTSARSAILAFMAGIPQRIGANLRGRGSFLTVKVENRADIHELQRYFDVITPIAGTDHDEKLEFWGVSGDDEEFVDRILEDYNGFLVGINISTTWPSKQWPVEQFADLIDSLSQQSESNILLTGSPGDVQLGDEIMKRVSSKPSNLIGKTTLWQLGALIKRCKFYITCDSGPMHISAALDTPTVALFGPTDPIRHGPRGKGYVVIEKDVQCRPCYERECKKSHHRCMLDIAVEDIIKGIKEF